ncbi:MAG TPA: 2-C-methyl-D-erythritol 4-phosphate cytidylyltransferase [Candidatus Caenarcaniphilales bacterium]
MHLLIPAAGMGRRMGSDRNKLRLQLRGQPLLAWTLKAVQASRHIEWIGLIGQAEDWPLWQQVLANLSISQAVQFISGGMTRQESVYNGLQALPSEAEQVLIHDGARCLATTALVDRCAEAMNHYPGLVAAIPIKDTIKVVDEAGWVQSTPDRSQLWAAQTPQGFQVDKLRHCHEVGRHQGWSVTDDAALFEKFNLPVHTVLGEETNLKLTTPADLAIAELILRQRLEQN